MKSIRLRFGNLNIIVKTQNVYCQLLLVSVSSGDHPKAVKICLFDLSTMVFSDISRRVTLSHSCSPRIRYSADLESGAIIYECSKFVG